MISKGRQSCLEGFVWDFEYSSDLVFWRDHIKDLTAFNFSAKGQLFLLILNTMLRLTCSSLDGRNQCVGAFPFRVNRGMDG